MEVSLAEPHASEEDILKAEDEFTSMLGASLLNNVLVPMLFLDEIDSVNEDLIRNEKIQIHSLNHLKTDNLNGRVIDSDSDSDTDIQSIDNLYAGMEAAEDDYENIGQQNKGTDKHGVDSSSDDELISETADDLVIEEAEDEEEMILDEQSEMYEDMNDDEIDYCNDSDDSDDNRINTNFKLNESQEAITITDDDEDANEVDDEDCIDDDDDEEALDDVEDAIEEEELTIEDEDMTIEDGDVTIDEDYIEDEDNDAVEHENAAGNHSSMYTLAISSDDDEDNAEVANCVLKSKFKNSIQISQNSLTNMLESFNTSDEKTDDEDDAEYVDPNLSVSDIPDGNEEATESYQISDSERDVAADGDENSEDFEEDSDNDNKIEKENKTNNNLHEKKDSKALPVNNVNKNEKINHVLNMNAKEIMEVDVEEINNVASPVKDIDQDKNIEDNKSNEEKENKSENVEVVNKDNGKIPDKVITKILPKEVINAPPPSQAYNDSNNNVEKEDAMISEKSNKRRRDESPADNHRKQPDKKMMYDNEEHRASQAIPNLPNKKLCQETEANFASHNAILNAYLQRSSNYSFEAHRNTLKFEIEELNEKILVTEAEWNSLLHLKKVKEEVLARLERREIVNQLMTNESITNFLDEKIDTHRNNQNKNATGEKSSANMILQNRVNMTNSDKQNSSSSRLRNIFPKPTLPTINQQSLPVLTSIPNISIAAATVSASLASSSAAVANAISAARGETPPINSNSAANMMNGHSNANAPNNSKQTQPQIGRQGVILDVNSFIEAFRKENPVTVPRRGRRMKNINSDKRHDNFSSSNNHRLSTESRVSNMGHQMSGADINNSGNSSTDSSPSNSNNPLTPANMSAVTVSFKDAFAKYKANERHSLGNNKQPYPEVTLHPVTNSLMNNQQQNEINLNNSRQNSSSLLHDFLTKTTSRPNSGNTSYSPTLARLLTTPDRISSHSNNNMTQQSTSGNSSSQITITPVVPAIIQQSLLQKQLQQQQRFRPNHLFSSVYDEADDSADRLVIDEGDTSDQNANLSGREFPENDVPKCQGCGREESQFVCAGCSNQWYCSKECQIAAWDDHSDVCN